MDEVDCAQTPGELRYILRELAREEVPLQTIAPKFTGRFNKGVDYRGDLALFEQEFEQDLMVIDEAVKAYGLPENLKKYLDARSAKKQAREASAAPAPEPAAKKPRGGRKKAKAAEE